MKNVDITRNLNVSGNTNVNHLNVSGLGNTGQLNVNGNISSTQTIKNSSSFTTQTGTIYIGSSNNERFNDFSKNLIFSSGGNGLAVGTLSAGENLTLGVDNTEIITINGTTDNVGIGTNTPTQLLDINSDTIRIRNRRTIVSSVSDGSAGEICFDSSYAYFCVADNNWGRVDLSLSWT